MLPIKAFDTQILDYQHYPNLLIGLSQAYAWGFDYRQWERHLNLLTWPEILRQFSLAAGYGPIWKQQETETINACIVDEGHHVHQKVPTKTINTGYRC